VFFVVVIAALMWALTQSPEKTETPAETPEATPTVETQEPTPQPDPPAPAADTGGDEPAQRPTQNLARQAINVVGSRGVVQLHVTVETSPEAGQHLRVILGESVKHLRKKWTAHLDVAAFIAFDGNPDAPQGLRVTLEVGEEPPRADMLAALTVALRIAAAGRPYPADQLLAAIVAPDGTLVQLQPHAHLERLASRAGLQLAGAADLNRLLVAWGESDRRQSPARAAKSNRAPTDVYAPDLDAIRSALRQVLGTVLAKRPARLDPPADWRDITARGEGRMRTARVRTLDELITLGLGSAQIREGIRLVRFSAERIIGYTQRMVRDGTAVEGWPASWLTLLVMSRIDGERLVRAWLPLLPSAVTRPRLLRTPLAWLRTRAERLKYMGNAWGLVQRSHLQLGGRLPRPYPSHDQRNLSWPRQGEKLTRGTAADWGVNLQRVATVWSQTVIALALEPQRVTRSAEPDAVSVHDERRLGEMLVMARRLAQAHGARVLTREGTLLTEVRRILSRTPTDGGRRTADQLLGLERLWLATLLSNEAVALKPVLAGAR